MTSFTSASVRSSQFQAIGGRSAGDLAPEPRRRVSSVFAQYHSAANHLRRRLSAKRRPSTKREPRRSEGISLVPDCLEARRSFARRSRCRWKTLDHWRGTRSTTRPCAPLQGLLKASWLPLAQTCKCVSLRSRNETATRKRLKMEKEPAHPRREQSDPGRSDLRSATAAQGWRRWSSGQPRKAIRCSSTQCLEPDQSGVRRPFIGCVRQR